jgi:hypothetical protein
MAYTNAILIDQIVIQFDFALISPRRVCYLLVPSCGTWLSGSATLGLLLPSQSLVAVAAIGCLDGELGRKAAGDEERGPTPCG